MLNILGTNWEFDMKWQQIMKSVESKWLLLIAFGLMSAFAQADTDSSNISVNYQSQDFTVVKDKVDAFILTQVSGYSGKVTVNTAPIDKNLKLQSCADINVFFPPGTRAWGKTTVGVSCNTPSWQIYLQTNISVQSQYIIASGPLTQGRIVKAEDITYQSGDLAQLPSGVLTNSEQVIGRTVNVSLAPGTVLRQDMLKLTPVILQGQKVILNSIGDGFQVSAEGQALTSAGDGQVVQVKVASGQVISGIARNGGQIEVRF
jgi:flagella basal body P-ring formation protein FlgA